MKELMKNLNDISVDEDESLQYDRIFNEILDKGAKVGAAILGGMAVADIVSLIGDNMVSQNNSKIANEIAALEEDNLDAANTIRIYEEFFPLIDQLVENFERAEEEGEDISKDTYYAMISSLNDILLELYYQTLENIDISPEDEEEYTRYVNWLSFWALLFYDNNQFRISHSIELLEDMPEFWDMVVNLVDKILEDEWEDSFSNKVYDFARTAVDNSEKILELMSSSDWDDELWDSLSELIESNNQAVKSLSDVLDRATDYFNEFLRTIYEE